MGFPAKWLIIGKRGPAPDPVPLKILKGIGHGRDSMGRLIPDVPRFERGAPQPPSVLSPVARELWEATAPTLEALDLIKPEDGPSFEAYCECWATYREGLIIINPNTGMPHKNPALVVVETAGMQLLRYAQQFGLTPSAEINLAKPPRPDAGDDDPFGA
jgi:P27 family predicted phage terminase small subunit